MIVGEFVWDAGKTMEILYLNSKSTEQEFALFAQTIYYIYSVKLLTPKIRTHSTKSLPVTIVTKAKKLSRVFITPHLTSPTSIGCKSTHDYIRLIDLKHHIDYFSKGPKSSRTDRTQKKRSFQVNLILSFCHTMISMKCNMSGS